MGSLFIFDGGSIKVFEFVGYWKKLFLDFNLNSKLIY